MAEPQPAPTGQEQPLVPATLVAWSLAAVNVGLFLAMGILGGGSPRRALIALGAKVGPLIDQGEVWRLLTAAFLHVNFTHLAFNTIALLTFGRLAEVVYGHSRFLAIYLVSAIAGSTASYAFTRGLSVGASGALFGIGGALVVFYALNRRLAGPAGRSQLLGYSFLLAVNVVFGLVQPGVDNWGHLGGLAAGVALGLALAPRLVARCDPEGQMLEVRAVPSPPASWLTVPGSLVVLGALVRLIQLART